MIASPASLPGMKTWGSRKNSPPDHRWRPRQKSSDKLSPGPSHRRSPITSPTCWRADEFFATFNDDYSGVTPDGKELISVTRLRELRPTEPGEKLVSSGFVMLINQCKDSARPRGRSLVKKKVPLREHKDRFIVSVFRKSSGLWDETSIEARRAEANIALNKLDARNEMEIIAEVARSEVPDDTLVELLIARACADVENPEKSDYTKYFARLATRWSMKDRNRLALLRNKSIVQFKERVGQSTTSVNVLQGILVWLGHLLVSGVVYRNEFFSAMEDVVKSQPTKIRAVEVLRPAMLIAGEYIDAHRYLEAATFWLFMRTNKGASGYLRFLVADLESLRQNGWRDVVIKHESPKKAVSATANLEIDLMASFVEWRASGGKQDPTTKAQFDLVCQATFELVHRSRKWAEDFAVWASRLWKSLNPSRSRVTDAVLTGCKVCGARITEEKNVALWFIIIQFIAGLYECGLIDCEQLLRFVRLENCAGCSTPPLSVALAKVGDIVYFWENDARRLLAKPLPVDVRAAIIRVTDWTSDDMTDKDELSVGLFVRDALQRAFSSEGAELSDVGDLVKPLSSDFAEAKRLHGELIRTIFAFSADDCNISGARRVSLDEWFSALPE